MKSNEVQSLLLGLLTIAFVILKLVGVIDWSWWYVLSPLWIPLALGLSIFCIAFVVACFWYGIFPKDKE